MDARGLSFLIVAAAFAGCVSGSGPDDAPPSTMGPAPDPSADAATGAIRGVVVDEEQVPVAGATVSVGQASLVTDAQGTFTANGLDPGEYVVLAVKLGYEQAGKKVVVGAGEIVEIQIQIKGIVISDVYHESFQRTGVVTGQWTVNYIQNFVNNTVLDAIMCSPCTWPITFKPGIKDAVTDVLFKPSVTGPGVNEIIIWTYNKAGATEVYSGIASAEMEPRDTHHWTTSQVNNLKGVTKARLQLHGPDPDHPGIAFQQRVDLWQTWGFGDLLPENFTMLPPP